MKLPKDKIMLPKDTIKLPKDKIKLPKQGLTSQEHNPLKSRRP